MAWKLLSLLACVGLSGCAAVPSFRSHGLFPAGTGIVDQVEQIDSAELVQLQPGSQVKIACDSNCSVTGTVLQSNADGIVLINCVYLNRNATNEVTSKRRMPCHWVSIRRISRVEIITPAPVDFVAPLMQIDTNDTEEFSHGRQGIEFNTPRSWQRP